VLAGACSGTPRLTAPRVHGAAARACADLVSALPDRVADQGRREVDTGAGYGAAWGDPPIELRCGVPRPRGLDAYAACQVVNGVGWFLPEAELRRGAGPLTMTTVGRSTYVQVRVPQDYLPPAATMADLAAAVRRSVPQVRPCV